MKFIIITGPPAVGKMAVGIEISKKTGYKILHNHGTIELLIPIFTYGTPKFHLLNNEFRKRIFEEVSTSDLPGFIFTYVTAFSLKEEREHMEHMTKIFTDQGNEVLYVELYATLEKRLERNKTPLRLDMKPSKRDTQLSDKRLLGMEKKYIMNSTKEYPFFFKENYLKIDTTHLSVEEAADLVIHEFSIVKEE